MVALALCRIIFAVALIASLFETRGPRRFWFMWDELAHGALGAVVLADTRRLSDCFPAVDFFERRCMPFVVAVNCFDGARRFAVGDIRAALDLDDEVPVMLCDARKRSSCRDVLVALADHALALLGRPHTPAEAGHV